MFLETKLKGVISQMKASMSAFLRYCLRYELLRGKQKPCTLSDVGKW